MEQIITESQTTNLTNVTRLTLKTQPGGAQLFHGDYEVQAFDTLKDLWLFIATINCGHRSTTVYTEDGKPLVAIADDTDVVSYCTVSINKQKQLVSEADIDQLLLAHLNNKISSAECNYSNINVLESKHSLVLVVASDNIRALCQFAVAMTSHMNVQVSLMIKNIIMEVPGVAADYVNKHMDSFLRTATHSPKLLLPFGSNQFVSLRAPTKFILPLKRSDPIQQFLDRLCAEKEYAVSTIHNTVIFNTNTQAVSATLLWSTMKYINLDSDIETDPQQIFEVIQHYARLGIRCFPAGFTHQATARVFFNPAMVTDVAARYIITAVAAATEVVFRQYWAGKHEACLVFDYVVSSEMVVQMLTWVSGCKVEWLVRGDTKPIPRGCAETLHDLWDPVILKSKADPTTLMWKFGRVAINDNDSTDDEMDVVEAQKHYTATQLSDLRALAAKLPTPMKLNQIFAVSVMQVVVNNDRIHKVEKYGQFTFNDVVEFVDGTTQPVQLDRDVVNTLTQAELFDLVRC